MAVLRAFVDQEVLMRVGAFMTAAGISTQVDATTDTVLAITPAISWALRQMDMAPASLGVINDAALIDIDASNIDQLLDYAEYRILLNVFGMITSGRISLGPLTEDFGDLIKQVEAKITAMRSFIASVYGLAGPAGLTTGTVRYNFLSRTTLDG